MISIDTVYQKVLALANKEQRGYITPQEYNLFANHAQMEILEQYFYDLNQFSRVPGNSTEYSDMLSVLQEKLSVLEARVAGIDLTNTSNIFNFRTSTLTPNLYKLGTVTTTQGKEIEQVNNNEWYLMNLSPLTTPTISRPVYVNRANGIHLYPDTINEIDISYIIKPNTVNWSYVVINNKPLYTPTGSVHFDLHASEETELVYKILGLAGIAIEKPQLTQVATGLQGAAIQQEKQ